jgi:mercuric ion binding protein
MKKMIMLIPIMVLMLACSDTKKEGETQESTVVSNGISTSTFKVWGNCEMCKETIEGSLKEEGVYSSNWNTESKMIEVVYDSSKISLDQIQKNIASVGYDNEKYKGDDKAYSNLPGCCQYDRK